MAKRPSAIGSETDLLVCPYNKSHLILRHRFQVHLIRCRRSYPNSPMVICPFNVTHRVNSVELEWHVSTCVDRQNFEHFRHQDAPIIGLSSTINYTFYGNATVLNTTYGTADDGSIKGGEYLESSENWDDHPEHPGYNPNEYVEKSEILRIPVNMTPSQRSAFRLSERKRLQALMK